MKTIDKLERHALEIFYHALRAVDPARLVKERVRTKGHSLQVDGKTCNL